MLLPESKDNGPPGSTIMPILAPLAGSSTFSSSKESGYVNMTDGYLNNQSQVIEPIDIPKDFQQLSHP